MNTERTQLHRALAATIWEASRADEGTISYTGANHVADALIDGPLAGLLAENIRLARALEILGTDDGLMTERDDLRAEVERLRDICKAWKRENGIIADQRDALRAEVERLKEAAAKAADAQKQLRNRLMAQVAAVAEALAEWDWYPPAEAERDAGGLGSNDAAILTSLRAALDDPDEVLNAIKAEAWGEGEEAGRENQFIVGGRCCGDCPVSACALDRALETNPYREGSEA